MKWSDPQAWPLGVIPNSFQSKLIILACQEILIDIDPPFISQIEVFGTLVFDESRSSTTIRADNIEILSGKILAGSATNPYKGIINIYINGDQYTNLIMVAGTLELYGNPPSVVQTRIIEFAKKGDNSIHVENSQDWQIGDLLIIGPSGSDPLQTEELIIQSISDNIITLNQPLQFSHNGAADQTLNKQNIGNLDMRGIVGHLTRNIRIISGQNQNGYGCRIAVQKYNNYNGYIKLSGVEIQKCGQPYSDESPALDIFDISFDNYNHIIDKCSIHHSSGTQLRVQNSKSIQITNNIFYQGQNSLVIIHNNQNLQFQMNLLMFVRSGTLGTFTYDKQSNNYNTQSISDNLGTASQDSGFVFMSSSCSTSTPQFFNNQCSSVNNICFQYFTLDGTCDQISSAFAYHAQIGIQAILQTNQINVNSVILIENQINLVTRMVNKQILSNEMYVSNIFISSYLRKECTSCYTQELKPYCKGSVGIQMATVSASTNQQLNLNEYTRIDVIATISSIDARVYVDSVVFDGFKNKYTETDYCGQNAVFRQHPQAVDMSAQYYLTNTKCQNCNNEGLFFGLRQPDPNHIGWLGGCGTFQCTGLINILIEDQDGSFLGQVSQALGNNFYYAPNVTYYSRVDAWIGFLCQGKQISVLNFMSTAPDKNKRLYSPIQLTDGKFFNQINSYREWLWNGNQPMNKRESRFVSIIQINSVVNMTNAGDNPTESIYWLSKRRSSGSPSDWIILQWQFSTPNIIQVSVNNKTIQPGITLNNEHWDLEQKTSECGANNYFYQNRTIHFVVTGDISCIVKVSLKNTMQISSRIAVTENQFLGKNFLQFAFASLGGDPYNYFILGIKKVKGRLLQGQEFIDVDWGYADPSPIGSTEADESQNRLQNLTEKVNQMQSAPSSPYKILSSSVTIKTVDIQSFKSTEPQVDTTPQVTIPIQSNSSSQQNQGNTDYIYVPPKANLTQNTTAQQNSTSDNLTISTNQTNIPQEQSDNTTKIIVATVVPISVIIIIAIGLVIMKKRTQKRRQSSYQVENDVRLNEPQHSNIQSREEQVHP